MPESGPRPARPAAAMTRVISVQKSAPLTPAEEEKKEDNQVEEKIVEEKKEEEKVEIEKS